MYFTTNEMLATLFFTTVISQDAFLTVLWFLHFTPDTDAKKFN